MSKNVLIFYAEFRIWTSDRTRVRGSRRQRFRSFWMDLAGKRLDRVRYRAVADSNDVKSSNRKRPHFQLLSGLQSKRAPRTQSEKKQNFEKWKCYDATTRTMPRTQSSCTPIVLEEAAICQVRKMSEDVFWFALLGDYDVLMMIYVPLVATRCCLVEPHWPWSPWTFLSLEDSY